MAVIRVCDFKVSKGACGNAATETIEASVARRKFRGDVCPTHVKKVEAALISLGLEVQSVSSDYKARKANVSASGEPFTTSDVRAWAESEGRVIPRSGRLPKTLMEEYAEVH